MLGSYTTAIEEVLDDGQLLANGQQTAMDAQGRLKRQRQADAQRGRSDDDDRRPKGPDGKPKGVESLDVED